MFYGNLIFYIAPTFSEPTMKILMVLKNLLIFTSGVLFGVVAISLVSAYYMLNSERKKSLADNVQFEESAEENKVYWNPPKNFKQALETFYTALVWHLSSSKKTRTYRNKKRAKILLVVVLIAFILLLILSLWLSINIQHLRSFEEALSTLNNMNPLF